MSLPYPPEELISRVFISVPSLFPKTELLWVATKKVFSCGSGSAIQICEHFGLNPHSEVQDLRKTVLSFKQKAPTEAGA